MPAADQDDPVRAAITACGSQARLGLACGLSQASISKALKRGRFTPETAVRVESATGIPRQKLCPGISGAVEERSLSDRVSFAGEVPPEGADPVLAAIEAHREAWAEFSAEARWFFGKATRGRPKNRPEFDSARQAYEAMTDAFVRTEIRSLAGLQAFADYIAGLRAYGRGGASPWVYAAEVWHLSDAVEAIATTLRRLSRSGAAVSGGLSSPLKGTDAA